MFLFESRLRLSTCADECSACGRNRRCYVSVSSTSFAYRVVNGKSLSASLWKMRVSSLLKYRSLHSTKRLPAAACYTSSSPSFHAYQRRVGRTMGPRFSSRSLVALDRLIDPYAVSRDTQTSVHEPHPWLLDNYASTTTVSTTL